MTSPDPTPDERPEPASRPEGGRVRARAKWVKVAVAAALVFAGLVLVSQLATDRDPAGSGPTAADGRAEGEPGFVRRDPDDPMALGELDAPVVLSLWTDFRCPFCAVFNRETLPDVIAEYVDTGKVRLEVHDVAFFGARSEDAAVAGRAAAEQGRFFEFMREVYAAAPEDGHPSLPREQLIGFARSAGMPDLARFRGDLDRTDLRAHAQASNVAAQRGGVNSVPFFVAGETSLSGAQPVKVFREYLDDAVARAE